MIRRWWRRRVARRQRAYYTYVVWHELSARGNGPRPTKTEDTQ